MNISRYRIVFGRRGPIGGVLVSLLLALLFSGLSAPLSASATPTVGPQDSSIRYVGRWDKSSSTEYVSYWGGAYLKVDFSGQTVGLELGAAADILVSIDGGPDVTYSQATGTVNLTPSALTSGIHSLRVATRYITDSIHFRGLDLGAGGATSLPAVSDKLIEFVGDSITAGAGDSNATLSDYAWLAGEQLHAEHTQIAYSGICLVNMPCYSPNSVGMSYQFFKQQTVTSPSPTDWNFATYQPSDVVINLGTNDYQYPNPSVDPSIFQSTYVSFLQNIRAKYPGAEIFALRTFNGYYAAQTLSAVNIVSGQGDAHVHYVDTTGWLLSSDTVDGIHPTDTGHEKLASKMAATLAPYLYPQNGTFANYPPSIEDFQNTTDWVPGDDANASIYTIGTSAEVSCVCAGGLPYGSVARQVSYNLDANPFLTIRINGVSNAVGNVSGGQWGLKVNDGAGSDILLQGATSQTGLVTYDLRALTGWTGVKTFKIKLFVLNNSVEVGAISSIASQVARGASVTASSTVNGNVPSNLTDGNPATRWESATADPQWVTVDLGHNSTVDGTTLHWETASAKSFQVQLSTDNLSWSAVYSTTAGPGGVQTINFTPATARYLRVYMTQRNTQWAYSMWDIEVYRHDLAASASVQVSSTTNGNVGPYLTDGNASTRWESQTADPQGVIVDLGSSQTVGRVLMNWETASAKSFQVLVSNDRASWTGVYSTSSGPGGTQSIAISPMRARYVWVYMTQRNTQWAYSIWDIEVYAQ